jgi:hypothetical protein
MPEPAVYGVSKKVEPEKKVELADCRHWQKSATTARLFLLIA